MLYKNINKNRIKNYVAQGFTLAEVLITLVIVGVIAAMTLPSLMQSTNKQETVTALKKADSVLKQSLYKIANNNGYTLGDYEFLAEDTYTFLDEFAKVVNVAKTEEFGPNYKYLDGSDSSFGSGKIIITADGILYYAYSSPRWRTYGLTNDDSLNNLVTIIVDVNGFKKPNKLGEDAFVFYLINKKGIMPAGSDSDFDCQPGDYGYTCTAKFIKESKVSYNPYEEVIRK